MANGKGAVRMYSLANIAKKFHVSEDRFINEWKTYGRDLYKITKSPKGQYYYISELADMKRRSLIYHKKTLELENKYFEIIWHMANEDDFEPDPKDIEYLKEIKILDENGKYKVYDFFDKRISIHEFEREFMEVSHWGDIQMKKFFLYIQEFQIGDTIDIEDIENKLKIEPMKAVGLRNSLIKLGWITLDENNTLIGKRESNVIKERKPGGMTLRMMHELTKLSFKDLKKLELNNRRKYERENGFIITKSEDGYEYYIEVLDTPRYTADEISRKLKIKKKTIEERFYDAKKQALRKGYIIKRYGIGIRRSYSCKKVE